MNQKSKRREKSNPRGLKGEAWFARRMELTCLKVGFREFLTGKTASNPIDGIWSLPTSPVRGDYVPTLADAYWALVDTINRDRHNPEPPEQLQLTLPASNQPLRIRVQVLNPKTQQWETNT